MNWQIGDVAIVRNTVDPFFYEYVGTECTIVTINPRYYLVDTAYAVRLLDNAIVGAQEIHLRKRDDNDDVAHDDSRDKCEWSDCVWQPKEPVTVERN